MHGPCGVPSSIEFRELNLSIVEMSLFSCIAGLKEFQNDCHFVTPPLNFGSDNFGSRGLTELLVIVLC